MNTDCENDELPEEPAPIFSSAELRGHLSTLTAKISPKRRLAAVLPLLAALCLWFVLPGQAAVLPDGGGTGPWSLIFDDEFQGTSLNTNLWSTGWFGSGVTPPVNTAAEQECYNPANVSVDNGLTLSASKTPAQCEGLRPYSSGMVTTDGKFSFTYGFMEARIWLPANGSSIADWPAFWADGQSWPTDGEIDVLEGLGGSACYHFHNTAGAQGGCAAGDYAGGWHTFGANWEPGSITYYYDGVDVGTVTKGITSSPMYLILNLAVSQTYGGPTVVPASMRVQYVRVWKLDPAPASNPAPTTKPATAAGPTLQSVPKATAAPVSQQSAPSTPAVQPETAQSGGTSGTTSGGTTDSSQSGTTGVTITPVQPQAQQYTVSSLQTPETGVFGYLILRSLIVAIALILSGLIIVSGLKENPHRLPQN